MSDPAKAEAGRRQEGACQDRVAGLLGNLGMRVDRWEVLPGRYDVVGTLPGQGSGRSWRGPTPGSATIPPRSSGEYWRLIPAS